MKRILALSLDNGNAADCWLRRAEQKYLASAWIVGAWWSSASRRKRLRRQKHVVQQGAQADGGTRSRISIQVQWPPLLTLVVMHEEM